jgi:hypothetical protein
MTGSQLHNYDLAIEFSEDAYRKILGVFFDTGNFLCNLLDTVTSALGIPSIPCPIFVPTISFDTPTDIPVPSGATNLVDVSMQLGPGGSIGSLRFVAQINVSRDNSLFDLIRVDLSNTGLVYSNIRLGLINDTNNSLTSALHAIGQIPLVPIPVTRTSILPSDIIRADARIIDDTSPLDLDASAVLLTFGGGAPGDLTGFTQSFVPSGETGAIGVNFDWICRIIVPQLARALGTTPDAFNAPCHLVRSIPLSGDHNPHLDSLDLTLDNGALHVTAGVSASDTGWSATATVGGSILIEVLNGRLILTSNIDNPHIETNLDWWVWLAAAVVGAIIGGIIAGVIGAIVGAILVPLITWLAEQLLDGIITAIAQKIVDSLKALSPNVNVDALGLNIIFQEIHIDDIVIGAQVQVTENAPIRSTGQVRVLNGQFIDLDNGKVGDNTLSGADLAWEGQQPNRLMRTICHAKMAATGRNTLDIPRFELYGLNYLSPSNITETQMGLELFLGIFIPNNLVNAVITDENRFSLVQVVGLDQNSLTLVYKTFEKPLPNMQIIGGFNTEQPTSRFLVSPSPLGAEQLREVPFFEPTQPCTDLVASEQPSPTDGRCLVRSPLGNRVPGVWKIPQRTGSTNQGKFRAIVENFHAEKYEWSLESTKLTTKTGSIEVQGAKIDYEVQEDAILLEATTETGFSFELSCIALSKNDASVSTQRCIEVGGTTLVATPAPVTFATYQLAFTEHYGMLEVPYQAAPKMTTN